MEQNCGMPTRIDFYIWVLFLPLNQKHLFCVFVMTDYGKCGRVVDVKDYWVFQVKHGCDTNVWGPGPNGCQQTLLHKSIDENNEDIACFLIKR